VDGVRKPRGRVSDLPVAHDFRHKPHHRGGRFHSPPSPHRDGRGTPRMAAVLWQLLREGNAPVAHDPSHVWSRQQALQGLALHEADGEATSQAAIQSRPAGAAETAHRIALTWLGQSCFHFRAGPLGVVTDPFLGQRASPLRFSGPRRLIPSPLTLDDLSFDVIVMSHNHYDHFCRDTLAAVRHKSSRIVVTTLGMAPAFHALGYREVYELDWYQQVEIDGVRFAALPAYHSSGRTLWDTDRTLWASFAVHAPERSVFFAGDTGYGPEFARIGALTGPYDVALVPIGAYGPRDVFASVHADPEEAVRMGRDVGAGRLVGMHWGTVRLTTEPFWEPRQRFLENPYAAPPRSVLAIGETRLLQIPPPGGILPRREKNAAG